MPQVVLRPGDVVHVGAEASVQFSGERALTFRIIRVDPRVTYDGWIWLDGYVVGPAGNALQRRRIFVRQDGLRAIRVNRVPAPRSGSRPVGRP
ncbi:hypothetical protein ACWT_8159 [Actinoplanes sp. SE50]|uniref:hypothetical protein n=1 Tax=unclassified Actinoplanes TaxID=2626549 RepID=UPI00023EDD64|nr:MULTISPECIES: hypothetical protein [unclassified Actinoplanes]AEV89166.1 hypothetical protein ACPL_8290 [Actinoplanes sp. SE50/110]ATO87574.1 hypothetical protein ACWT_8159 [Actinoplanes sp. SE50]SLM04992.1 hypothetical protein ACSP50_8307 [Actinoplanes sp. SE50/110]